MKQSELIKTMDKIKKEVFETYTSQKSYVLGTFDALNRVKHEMCTLEEAEQEQQEEVKLLNWRGDEVASMLLPKSENDLYYKVLLKQTKKEVNTKQFILSQDGELFYTDNTDLTGIITKVPKEGDYIIEICTKKQGTIIKVTY